MTSPVHLSLPALGSVGVVLLLLSAGCASVATPGPPAWQSPRGRDHPLVGRIWDVRAARFVDESALVVAAGTSRFVLLGEKHDNADHHLLQARMLQSLVTAGRRPAVGFEMLSADQAPALGRYLAGSPTAAGLGAAVDWEHSGWPTWQLYQPVAEVALAARLPIVATNLSRAQTTAVRQRGIGALGADVVTRLGLDQPLSPDTRTEMAQEIKDSHCGYAPEAMVAVMIPMQRAWDAEMATRLAAAAEGDGAVLVAGAGHVRTDRGVPAGLRRLAPGARIVSVAFVEVQEGDTEPGAYATAGRRLPYDYVWFTPRLDDLDPCEKFRAPLERLRERSNR